MPESADQPETTIDSPKQYASPFYRVSIKALVFDDQKRILVFRDDEDQWEMPGGGWEHDDESLEQCLKRELMEEVHVEPTSVGEVRFVYRVEHQRGYTKLCLAADVNLNSFNFEPDDDDLVEARFVTRDEFVTLNFSPNERGILEFVDKLWPPSGDEREK